MDAPRFAHAAPGCPGLPPRWTRGAKERNWVELCVVCAADREIGGWDNNGEIFNPQAGRIIVAFKGSTWMALGTTTPFLRRSCGFVAVNDGWTDLHDNRTLDWQYEA